MQKNYQSSLLVINNTIRRTIRLFKQMANIVDEDEIHHKFEIFIDTHEQFASNLGTYLDDDAPVPETPDALLQFPISIGDMLRMSAKSEKQILDRLDETLKITLPVAISSLLKENYSVIEGHYDYLQALSDLWE